MPRTTSSEMIATTSTMKSSDHAISNMRYAIRIKAPRGSGRPVQPADAVVRRIGVKVRVEVARHRHRRGRRRDHVFASQGERHRAFLMRVQLADTAALKIGMNI